MLRLISHNTNNITTTDLVCSMWDSFKDIRQKRIDAANTAPAQPPSITAPSAPAAGSNDEKRPLVEPAVEAKVVTENEKTK